MLPENYTCLLPLIDTGEISRYVRKTETANLLLSTRNGCLFMWGAYFCMGAYKLNVVVVIKMGAYIYGVLILCGCLLSRFYGIYIVSLSCILGCNSNTLLQFSLERVQYKLKGN